MPREVIQNPEPFQPFRLSVGWTRDADMQVGIQVEDPDKTILDVLFDFPGAVAGLGRALRDRIDPLHPTPPGADPDDPATLAALGEAVLAAVRESRGYVERDGVWVSLGRRQSNDLIRYTRKGRDGAFGRDE